MLHTEKTSRVHLQHFTVFFFFLQVAWKHRKEDDEKVRKTKKKIEKESVIAGAENKFETPNCENWRIIFITIA